MKSLLRFGISKEYWGPSGKMEIPGDGGSNMKPSGMENPVGWGVKLKKKTSVGGVWIFSGTTRSVSE